MSALPHKARQREHGFTLVEVVITTAIVAILAAIAIPSYENYLRKGRRQAGTTCVMDARDRMERYFQRSNAYPDTLGVVFDGNDSPDCPETDRYRLSLEAPGGSCTYPSCFTLRATPVAGSKQVKDGTLKLVSRFSNDPNKRLAKTRLVGTVEKDGWDDY